MQTIDIIKTLEDISDIGIVNYKQTDTLRNAIPLVKKQLPMPPVLKAPYYYCGACGQGIVGVERDGFGHAYCNDCGQKVKWDD
jgi:hypothetical protein